MEKLKRFIMEVGMSILFGTIFTVLLLWYLLEKGWLE